MKKVLVYLLFSVSVPAFGQVVIPDGAQVNPKAELKVYSTDKGVLIPRLTALQMFSIASPATGLLIYNTSNSDFYSFNGTTWESIGTTPTSSAAPAYKFEGEYYFNTTDNKLYYWDGVTTGWTAVATTSTTL